MPTATLLNRKPQTGRLPAPLVRLGRLEAWLARSERERRAAFALRYRVFVAEGGARPPSADDRLGIEAEPLDEKAHHLVVWDGEEALGTCRVHPVAPGARQGAAALFDIAPLLAAHPRLRFWEVGRFCVAPRARGGRVAEALWAGLCALARDHGVDVLCGAASFPGADPRAHAAAIGWLARNRPAAPGWQVLPHPHCAVPLPGAERGDAQEARAMRRALPPLLRGYLGLGASFSPVPARDPAFDTTDIFVTVPLAAAPRRHRDHFTRVTGRAL